MSNKDTQRRAIKVAIDYEVKQNRKPKNISEDLSGNGYDIKSGNRKIEVKGFSGNLPSRVVLNYYNYEAYKKNKNFWLYLVYNLNSRHPNMVTLKKPDILGEEFVSFEVRLDKKRLSPCI